MSYSLSETAKRTRRHIAFLGASGIGGNSFLSYHCRIGLVLLYDHAIVARRWMVTPFKGACDAVILASAALVDEFSGQRLCTVTREDSARGFFAEHPFKKVPASYEHLRKLRNAKAAGLFEIHRPEDSHEPAAQEHAQYAQRIARAAGTLDTNVPGIWHPYDIKMDKPGDSV